MKEQIQKRLERVHKRRDEAAEAACPRDLNFREELSWKEGFKAGADWQAGEDARGGIVCADYDKVAEEYRRTADALSGAEKEIERMVRENLNIVNSSTKLIQDRESEIERLRKGLEEIRDAGDVHIGRLVDALLAGKGEK